MKYEVIVAKEATEAACTVLWLEKFTSTYTSFQNLIVPALQQPWLQGSFKPSYESLEAFFLLCFKLTVRKSLSLNWFHKHKPWLFISFLWMCIRSRPRGNCEVSLEHPEQIRGVIATYMALQSMGLIYTDLHSPMANIFDDTPIHSLTAKELRFNL